MPWRAVRMQQLSQLYRQTIEYVRKGDTLVVTRLDWLARSTLHLCQIAEELKRKQANLQVLNQNIDMSDATGRLLFNMLGAIAQFETEIRAERQMDGIVKAKARGVQFGQRKKLTAPQITELQNRRKQGALIKTLMKTTESQKQRSIDTSMRATLSPLHRTLHPLNAPFRGDMQKNRVAFH